jgi:transitional endoplasmic reticulum ATPase
VQARVLSTLLTEMDGLAGGDGVLVVGATNRVDLLDDALLRPGRFDEIIRVDRLTDADRLAVLRIHARRLPTAPDLDLVLVSQRMSTASGAQVQAVCQEAALRALRRAVVGRSKVPDSVEQPPQKPMSSSSVSVGMDDFWAAIQSVLASPSSAVHGYR